MALGTDQPSIEVLIRARLDQYEADLQLARAAAQHFEQQVVGGMRNATAAQDQASSSVQALAGWWHKVKFAALAAIGVFSVRQLVGLADTWSDLNSLLKANVGGQDAATAAMARLEVVARRTYSSLQQTVQGFVFNARALKDLGYNTAAQLDFTESLNNAMVVSGARGERAAAVQNALSKSMALGRMQGDQLNTVMSMGGRVADLLAEELGTTVNGLRAFGRDGKITADVIANALIKNLEKMREEADAMPATMADAFVLMGNAVLAFVGRFDQAFNITGAMAVNLVAISDVIKNSVGPAINLTRFILDATTKALSVFGIEMGTVGAVARIFFVTILGTAALLAVNALTVAVGTHLVTALNAFGNAVKAHPVIAIIAVLIGAAYAAYEFRDAIKSVTGIDVVGVFKGIGNAVLQTFMTIFGVGKFIVQNFGDALVVFQSMVAEASKKFFAAIGVDVDWWMKAFGRTVTAVKAIVEYFSGLLSAIFEEVKQKAIDLYNWLTAILPTNLAQKLGVRSGIGTLVGQQLGKPQGQTLAMPDDDRVTSVERAAERLALATVRLNQSMATNFSTDYVAGLMDVVFGTGDATDATADLDAALKAALASMGAETDEAKKLREAWEGIIDSSYRFIETQEIERLTLGMNREAANAFRYEMDLLNQAIDAGIKLTPEQVLGLQDLAASMAAAEEQTTKLAEQFEFARESTRSFVMDLKGGIQQGQSFLESAVNAMINVLDKLVDKILNDVVNAFFEMGSVAGGSGGGGLFGILAGLLGAGRGGGATGASMNLLPHARGGVITRPTIFPMARGMGLAGEAGFEGLLPLRRMPSGNLGVEASTGSRGYADNRVYNIDARGAQRGVGEEIKAALHDYDARLPDRMQQIEQHPRRR